MNRAFSLVWNCSRQAWAVAPEGVPSGRGASGGLPGAWSGARLQLAVAACLLGFAGAAAADCSGTTDIVCSPGTDQTTTVGLGPAAARGITVTVQPAAVVSTGEVSAISTGDNSTINIQAGATVRNNATTDNGGLYGSGPNTIEFGSNNTLTIGAGATVRAAGNSGTGEAINPMGSDNTIINNGSIDSQGGGGAIWLQSGAGNTTIVNGPTGSINFRGGNSGLLGVSGTMAVNFTNQGALFGSLNFADGDDTYNAGTGSTISGTVNGGGGNNTLMLSGTGTDTFSTGFTNFQNLVKTDSGSWTFNSLPGSGITSAEVAGGTLVLGADSSGYTGSMTVDAAGILQSSASFMPLAITDNGLVRFDQPNNASYTGLLSGIGGIEKTGAGTLILGGDQAITGTTTITGGTLQLGTGGLTGSVGGPIVDNAALVIDHSNVFTISQPISGSGSVTQAGSGTTVYSADNSYTGGTTISAGTLQLGNGGTTGSVTGPILNNAALVIDRSNSLTIAAPISGSGSLAQIGSGTTILAAGNTYSGTTTVAAGTLQAAVANAFSASSAHVVAAGATLDTGGFNQTLAALSNAGTVNLLSSTPGSTLTITGAYVGNNGVINLGTVLAGSTSLSDRLVLSGPAASATGSTSLKITNLGGLGAQTTGSGIEVVSAINGATTTAQTSKNAFSLAGGHVDAGAFSYQLYAADASGAGENWYLRSSTTTPVDPVPPGPPGPPFPLFPDRPGLPGGGGGTVTTYRSEVPLLAALPAQLRQSDLSMLGNLHRRIGDEAVPGDGASMGDAGNGRQAWARAIYNDIDIRQDGIAAAQSKGHVSGLQAGTDLFASGSWRAGVYVGSLDGSADVSGNAHGIIGAVGSNELRSRLLGGYATWFGGDGLYADSVLQGGSHDYTAQPNDALSTSGKASTLTASIEGGKAFDLGQGWKIEPQAQLIYQRASFDNLLISGALVRQDADAGWIARLGVRVKGDIPTSAGRLQPYARVNVYRASGGTDLTSFIGPAGSTNIGSATGYTSTELAGGMTLALNAATTLYGELGQLYNSGGDASVRSSLQGSLGIRVSW